MVRTRQPHEMFALWHWYWAWESSIVGNINEAGTMPRLTGDIGCATHHSIAHQFLNWDGLQSTKGRSSDKAEQAG